MPCLIPSFCSSINRNIVECKVIKHLFPERFLGVLIETLWNVKEESVREHIAETMVLIETLWNVKIISLKPFSIIFPRINRNIVECKAYPVPYQQRR